MWNNLTGALTRKVFLFEWETLLNLLPWGNLSVLHSFSAAPAAVLWEQKGGGGLPSLPPSLTLLEKEGGKEEDQTALRESKEGRDGERGGACLLA